VGWLSRRWPLVSAVALGALVVAALVGGSRTLLTRWLWKEPAVPPSAVLRWQAPVLSSPTTISVTDENARLMLDPDKDYVIRMPSTPVTVDGGVWIVGGRNVVMIGGEIFDDTPIPDGMSPDHAYGLYLKDQTGTVHLEGLWIHGRGIGQAIVLAEGRGATVQLQRSRLETLHPVGQVHTDGIQSWAGPYRLRLWNVTIRTAGVGLQTQPNQFVPVPVDTWEYRRVNIRQTTDDAYALWKAPGDGGWWREIHHNFWVKNLGHFAWPNRSSWNPGGGAKVEGQKVKVGIPPGGDYVPAGAVGVGYTSLGQ
jgi:hypothetical protein